MKSIHNLLLLVLLTITGFNCQKEISNSFPGSSTNQPAPLTATVQGNVLDENGQPAQGVVITAGLKSATTDLKGYFRITDADLDKNVSLVTAKKQGYFKAYRTFSATSGVNQLVIQLIERKLTGTVNGVTGGNVILSNGATVSLEANAVVNSSGINYAGTVNVFAAYINPLADNIGELVPGSFAGENVAGNKVVLESYGMLAVELASPSGEKLQIAAGKTATLTSPIPALLNQSAPASISLWYVDEISGIWKEEGVAQKTGSNYVGKVKHFSNWNYDLGLPSIVINATFETSDGIALKNMRIAIHSDTGTNVSYAHGYTDSLGQVRGAVPANRNLELLAFDQCNNVIYSKKIGPFSTDANLGTLQLSTNQAGVVTVKGKLLNCSNAIVTNGKAMIVIGNRVSYANVNANGEFTTPVIYCAGNGQTIDITGVDAIAMKQGVAVSVPLTFPVTNAGNIIACGISATSFINYTLDAVNYTLSDVTFDSLNIGSQAVQAGFNTTAIGTSITNNDYIRFKFAGAALAGSYPLTSLSVNNYSGTILTAPFNVTITAFPQSIGSFYEGNFSGSFKDSSLPAVTHTINASFRLKKLY